MKPVIAITLSTDEKPSDLEYRDAVLEAGGEPVILRPGEKTDANIFDGLLLAGGEDVDPDFYNEEKEPFCDEPNRQRDEFEFSLLKEFLSNRKPILAICRGIQLLNVGLGGSLYQDMETQLSNGLFTAHRSQDHLSREEKRRFRHQVKIETNSILHKFFGDEKEVNSRHHQSIKKLAGSLRVTAVSPDGIIEGVESTNHPWAVGVQWHPEACEVRHMFEILFKGFAAKCAEKVENASSFRRADSWSHINTPD